MDKTTEIRFCTEALEIRESEGKPTVLTGYAAVFDVRSFDLGGFVEVVRKGAFTRTINENADVFAFAHHNRTQVLARRSADTLKLEEDDRGLKFEMQLGQTTYAKDVIYDVRAKNITAMSFGFRAIKDQWTAPSAANGNLAVRELIDVTLKEISPVSNPAYPDTTIALRSMPATIVKPTKEELRRFFRSRFLPVE